jgi:hypothetical protein
VVILKMVEGFIDNYSAVECKRRKSCPESPALSFYRTGREKIEKKAPKSLKTIKNNDNKYYQEQHKISYVEVYRMLYFMIF